MNMMPHSSILSQYLRMNLPQSSSQSQLHSSTMESNVQTLPESETSHSMSIHPLSLEIHNSMNMLETPMNNESAIHRNYPSIDPLSSMPINPMSLSLDSMDRQVLPGVENDQSMTPTKQMKLTSKDSSMKEHVADQSAGTAVDQAGHSLFSSYSEPLAIDTCMKPTVNIKKEGISYS